MRKEKSPSLLITRVVASQSALCIPGEETHVAGEVADLLRGSSVNTHDARDTHDSGGRVIQ